MSRRGRQGKRQWQTKRNAYAQELTDHVSADAARQMSAWDRAGHIPLWVRINARLRGQRIGGSADERGSGDYRQ